MQWLHVSRHSGKCAWVYSSVVERLTADQQVPGSNPGAPYVCACSERGPFSSRRCHSSRPLVVVLCWYPIDVFEITQTTKSGPGGRYVDTKAAMERFQSTGKRNASNNLKPSPDMFLSRPANRKETSGRSVLHKSVSTLDFAQSRLPNRQENSPPNIFKDVGTSLQFRQSRLKTREEHLRPGKKIRRKRFVHI